jgi:hypothetical protein
MIGGEAEQGNREKMGCLAVHAGHSTPARVHGHFADLRRLPPYGSPQTGALQPGIRQETAVKASADRFDGGQRCHGAVRRRAGDRGESHSGRAPRTKRHRRSQSRALRRATPRRDRVNASQRSPTGAVCSPNPAALRARSAGIPVKNEVNAQIVRTFQAISPLEKSCPPTNPRMSLPTRHWTQSRAVGCTV